MHAVQQGGTFSSLGHPLSRKQVSSSRCNAEKHVMSPEHFVCALCNDTGIIQLLIITTVYLCNIIKPKPLPFNLHLNLEPWLLIYLM